MCTSIYNRTTPQANQYIVQVHYLMLITFIATLYFILGTYFYLGTFLSFIRYYLPSWYICRAVRDGGVPGADRLRVVHHQRHERAPEHGPGQYTATSSARTRPVMNPGSRQLQIGNDDSERPIIPTLTNVNVNLTRIYLWDSYLFEKLIF